jgi:hypothetical protein
MATSPASVTDRCAALAAEGVPVPTTALPTPNVVGRRPPLAATSLPLSGARITVGTLIAMINIPVTMEGTAAQVVLLHDPHTWGGGPAGKSHRRSQMSIRGGSSVG